jgi:hypothetical protein
MKNEMNSTDRTGRTLDQERAAAKRVQGEHEASGVNADYRATIGRMWTSARRWTWSFRFHKRGVAGRIDLGQGVTFEVVEQL